MFTRSRSKEGIEILVIELVHADLISEFPKSALTNFRVNIYSPRYLLNIYG